MKTLIVRCGQQVRFFVTNYPSFRFDQVAKQMPVPVTKFGVTDVRARDIKIKFGRHATQTEWFDLTPEFENYLSSIIS